MKIAYLICAHTDCTQLNRLIKANLSSANGILCSFRPEVNNTSKRCTGSTKCT